MQTNRPGEHDPQPGPTPWGVKPAWDSVEQVPLVNGQPLHRGHSQSALRAFGGVLLALGLFLLKFGKGLLIAVKGLKFATTSISMLVSVAAYALIWGWPFAVGFVLLIFVHEMGHAIQLRREGLPAGAPVFIPFLGAAIAMKRMPHDAAMEARVGLAGPILGSLGALAVFGAALLMDSAFLRDLAFTGFLINLFNLLPVSPLDGGRAMAAVSPRGWLVGLVLMVALLIVMPNPILILIALLGGYETWKRWRGRHEQSAYYAAVLPHQRLAYAAVYLGLVAGLAWLMHLSFVPRAIP